MTETESKELWCPICMQTKTYRVLWENSHAVLREKSHAVLTSPYAVAVVKSAEVVAKGGIIVGNKQLSAREWLKLCNVKVTRGKALLYKSVSKNFSTQRGVTFKPGTTHEASDWDANSKQECGRGIHYCPTVAQACKFRDEGVFVACEVAIADMAPLPAFALYPEKIRAKGGLTLYQVDADGKKIEAKL